jgi:hypothetical protein
VSTEVLLHLPPGLEGLLRSSHPFDWHMIEPPEDRSQGRLRVRERHPRREEEAVACPAGHGQ